MGGKPPGHVVAPADISDDTLTCRAAEHIDEKSRGLISRGFLRVCRFRDQWMADQRASNEPAGNTGWAPVSMLLTGVGAGPL